MKHAARTIIRQGSGSIVNTASIVGIRACIVSVAYSTAKAAVLHLTQCAAVELGEHHARVNSVSPGPDVTGIFLNGPVLRDDTADEQTDLVRAALEEVLPSHSRGSGSPLTSPTPSCTWPATSGGW